MSLHAKTLARFSHLHDSGKADRKNESRTLLVVVLTAVTMIVEIVAGYLTGSMALLADGWHMGTHAFALGVSYSAYVLARKHMKSQLFSFGTGKFGVLAGYTSALFLGLAAIWLFQESVSRIFNPVHIAFNEAIWVTLIGLTVNLVSVLILHQSDTHGHAHDHAISHHHDHEHESTHKGSDYDHHTSPMRHDHNYRAAYLHVIADTLTSVLALLALLSGRFLGWAFLDPVMGIVGAVMIGRWSYLLIRTTSLILLDGGIDKGIKEKIRTIIESDNESRIVDLHVWQLGSKDMAVIVSVVTGVGRKAEEYHLRFEGFPGLTHLSVEVHPCSDSECACMGSE
jgi:cation diffusion facilitator family transporter